MGADAELFSKVDELQQRLDKLDLELHGRKCEGCDRVEAAKHHTAHCFFRNERVMMHIPRSDPTYMCRACLYDEVQGLTWLVSEGRDDA